MKWHRYFGLATVFTPSGVDGLLIEVLELRGCSRRQVPTCACRINLQLHSRPLSYPPSSSLCVPFCNLPPPSRPFLSPLSAPSFALFSHTRSLSLPFVTLCPRLPLSRLSRCLFCPFPFSFFSLNFFLSVFFSFPSPLSRFPWWVFLTCILLRVFLLSLSLFLANFYYTLSIYSTINGRMRKNYVIVRCHVYSRTKKSNRPISSSYIYSLLIWESSYSFFSPLNHCSFFVLFTLSHFVVVPFVSIMLYHIYPLYILFI